MRRTLSDDRLHSKKTSRFWWLPDWLWHSVVGGIVLLALKKIASKALDALRAVKLRPLITWIGRALWRASPVLTFVFGFIFQQKVLAFAGMLSLPRVIGIIGA